MAIVSNIYKDNEKHYEGRVLYTYESNGYDDSDWYAIVWDDAEQKVKTINYATTRCAGYGDAEIDADGYAIRKAYGYYKKQCREIFDKHVNQKNAMKIEKGDIVIITKGRKIKKGTVAKCFWAGTRYNAYSRHDEQRIGLEVDGEKVFTNADNAEPVDWQNKLLTGKERKEAIRTMAINMMPYIYRKMLAETSHRGNMKGV